MVDYYKIIQRSFEIVKKNKALWVFGLVLATVTSGGFSGGGSYTSSGKTENLKKIFEQKEKLPKPVTEKLSQVLGLATQNSYQFLTDILSSIPLSFWLVLILSIILAILFSLILRIFLTNWAKGALFYLATDADKGEEVTLEKGSDYGRKHWLNLFIFDLILWASFFLISFSILIILFLFLLIPVIGPFIFVLLLVIFFFVFTASAIFLTVWSVLGELMIVLEDLTYKTALSFSLELTKKVFWQTLLMGIINQGIGCLTSLFMGLITIVIIMMIAFSFIINPFFGLGMAIISGTTLILIFVFSLLFSGIIKALTTTNWVLFYQEIKKTSF